MEIGENVKLLLELKWLGLPHFAQICPKFEWDLS